jgi:nicotinamide mononucleotide transporter
MTLILITELFSIETILFELIGYPVSFVEFAGALSGLVSVYLAARSNIWTWATGLVNVTCFFLIFYQVQLYSDMFLQAYFFAASVYGWAVWNRQDKNTANPITLLSNKQRGLIGILVLISTIGLGYLISNIHLYLPAVFVKAASFPYLDTFIAVLSILATLLLARRVLENWILWIIVDILSIGLYAAKGVMLISIEYFIFLCIASFGFYNWLRLLRDEKGAGPGEILTVS